MKAPHHQTARLAAEIFARSVRIPFDAVISDTDRPALMRCAVAAFEMAEIFGEEDERRWSARDTERAQKALEEANRK